MPVDGGDAEAVIEAFRREGVDERAVAVRLQREGGDAFAKSWRALLEGLDRKMDALAGGARAVRPARRLTDSRSPG
jgi:transaldolase